MTRVLTLEEIRGAIDPTEVLDGIEEAFAAYSDGGAEVPPVGHLDFEDPPGDCHIKYGRIRGDEHFVVKVATGFYRNPDFGLPSGDGLMLVFSSANGRLEAVLLDEGWLTDVRTAAAGAVAARHLAPRPVERIGIVGAGVQARMQLDWLRHVTECRDAMVWGRNPARVDAFRSELTRSGFRIGTAASVHSLFDACNLVVTTTASREPLVRADWVRPGTHITAMGADGGGKRELDAEVFARADLCVVDSISQCSAFGDSSFALRSGRVSKDRLVELGRIVLDPKLGRRDSRQITVADLTGVAVQDIRIASLVLRKV